MSVLCRKQLGPEDAVVLEASTGTFFWADLVESRGASCYVLDPYKFKIIRDSWNKTDKQDARNMAKALWVYLVTGEFGILTVYKPEAEVRELRRLFSQYRLMNRQIVMLKNNIQAILTDNGVELGSLEKTMLVSQSDGMRVLRGHELSSASRARLSLTDEPAVAVEPQGAEATDHERDPAGRRIVQLSGEDPDNTQRDHAVVGLRVPGGCSRHRKIQNAEEDERVPGVGTEGQRERGQEQSRTYQSGIQRTDAHAADPIGVSYCQRTA